MLTSPGFPDDVRRFIERNIDSLEELEVLLLLYRRPDKGWTAEAVAGALYTHAQSAGNKLLSLQRRGLAEMRDEQGISVFQGRSPGPNAPLVERLARLYAERRLTVTNIIYAKPLPNVQAFADAFDLRRESED